MAREVSEIGADFNASVNRQDFTRVAELNEEAIGIGTPEALAFSEIAQGMLCIYNGAVHESLKHYMQAQKMYEGIGNIPRIVEAMNHTAGVLANLDRGSEALSYYHRALQICEQHQLEFLASQLHNNIASVHDKTGSYPESIRYYLLALKRHETVGDRASAALVLGNIGMVYSETGLYDEALQYFTHALSVDLELGNYFLVGKTWYNMAVVYARMNDLEQAVTFYAKALDTYQSTRSEVDRVNSLFGLVATLPSLGRIDEARSFFSVLKDIEAVYPGIEATIREAQASLLADEGEYEAAVELYTVSLNESYQAGIMSMSREILQQLRDIAAKQGDFASYIKYNTAFIAIKDEINGIETRGRLAVLEVERGMMEQKRQLDAEREKRLHMESELALTAVHLATQVEQLGTLRKDLQQIIRKTDTSEIALQLIQQKLQELQTEEIDWVRFKEEFTKLHPDFTSALAAKHPNLTAQEIKMCQLSRIGLKSRDVARILCLSERTVEGHRLNLRKKLGLQTTDSLHGFLQKLV